MCKKQTICEKQKNEVKINLNGPLQSKKILRGFKVCCRYSTNFIYLLFLHQVTNTALVNDFTTSHL